MQQKHLLALLMFFTAQFSLLVNNSSEGQNLVPNPSFEDTVACPFNQGQINFAKDWINFNNTPDYFHGCNTSDFNVPDAWCGFQQAHSGIGMAGIVTYANPDAPDYPNYRELIGVQLNNPMQIGQKYFFSFFLNYSGFFYPQEQIASNKIGLKFTTSFFLISTMLNNSANYYTDSIITDTINWIKISGSLIADSTYKFIILGNFFQDSLTDILNLGGQHFGGASAYYYIDDVCVSTDSLYNEGWTSIKNILSKNTIRVFPNPFSDYITIEAGVEAISNRVELIDMFGLRLMQKEFTGNMVKLQPGNLSAGIYYLKISSSSTSETIKISRINYKN